MSRGRVQGMVIAGFAGIASSFYAFQPVIREHAEAKHKQDGVDNVPSKRDGNATTAPPAEKTEGGSTTGHDQTDASNGASRGKDS